MVFTKAILYCAVAMTTVYLTSVSADKGSNDHGGFSSLIPSVVACNYTEQSGASCISCHQALLCFSNNLGLQWDCDGFTPNCNEGRCSTTISESCTST